MSQLGLGATGAGSKPDPGRALKAFVAQVGIAAHKPMPGEVKRSARREVQVMGQRGQGLPMESKRRASLLEAAFELSSERCGHAQEGDRKGIPGRKSQRVAIASNIKGTFRVQDGCDVTVGRGTFGAITVERGS